VITIQHAEDSVTVTTEAEVIWEFSKMHKVMVLNGDMEFKIINAHDLRIGDALAMRPPVKYRYRTEGKHAISNSTIQHISGS